MGRIGRRELLTGCAALAASVEAHAETIRTEPLFVIGRSKNANELHFDARIRPAGTLDSDPIAAYWVMWAEGGRREGMSWLERRFAYRFTTRVDSGGNSLRLSLSALPSRSLVVRRGTGGRYRAEIPLHGQPAALDRVFVLTDESSVTPTVRYIDLVGRRISDGTRITERIAR